MGNAMAPGQAPVGRDTLSQLLAAVPWCVPKFDMLSKARSTGRVIKTVPCFTTPANKTDAENYAASLSEGGFAPRLGVLQGPNPASAHLYSASSTVAVKVFVKPADTPFSAAAHIASLNELNTALASLALPTVAPWQVLSEDSRAVIAVRQWFPQTLADWASARVTPRRRTGQVWVLYQLLQTLSQLHQVGVCHGYLSADNVMVSSWGSVFVTDFALWKPATVPTSHPIDCHWYFGGDATRCALAPERLTSPPAASPAAAAAAAAAAAPRSPGPSRWWSQPWCAALLGAEPVPCLVREALAGLLASAAPAGSVVPPPATLNSSSNNNNNIANNATAAEATVLSDGAPSRADLYAAEALAGGYPAAVVAASFFEAMYRLAGTAPPGMPTKFASRCGCGHKHAQTAATADNDDSNDSCPCRAPGPGAASGCGHPDCVPVPAQVPSQPPAPTVLGGSDGRVQPAMDIFSLGCVWLEAASAGRAVVSLPTVVRYLADPAALAPLLARVQWPVARAVAAHMLQRDPSLRLSAQQYLVMLTQLRMFPAALLPVSHFFSGLSLAGAHASPEAKIGILSRFHRTLLARILAPPAPALASNGGTSTTAQQQSQQKQQQQQQTVPEQGVAASSPAGPDDNADPEATSGLTSEDPYVRLPVVAAAMRAAAAAASNPNANADSLATAVVPAVTTAESATPATTAVVAATTTVAAAAAAASAASSDTAPQGAATGRVVNAVELLLDLALSFLPHVGSAVARAAALQVISALAPHADTDYVLFTVVPALLQLIDAAAGPRPGSTPPPTATAAAPLSAQSLAHAISALVAVIAPLHSAPSRAHRSALPHLMALAIAALSVDALDCARALSPGAASSTSAAGSSAGAGGAGPGGARRAALVECAAVRALAPLAETARRLLEVAADSARAEAVHVAQRAEQRGLLLTRTGAAISVAEAECVRAEADAAAPGYGLGLGLGLPYAANAGAAPPGGGAHAAGVAVAVVRTRAGDAVASAPSAWLAEELAALQLALARSEQFVADAVGTAVNGWLSTGSGLAQALLLRDAGRLAPLLGTRRLMEQVLPHVVPVFAAPDARVRAALFDALPALCLPLGRAVACSFVLPGADAGLTDPFETVVVAALRALLALTAAGALEPQMMFHFARGAARLLTQPSATVRAGALALVVTAAAAAGPARALQHLAPEVRPMLLLPHGDDDWDGEEEKDGATGTEPDPRTLEACLLMPLLTRADLVPLLRPPLTQQQWDGLVAQASAAGERAQQQQGPAGGERVPGALAVAGGSRVYARALSRLAMRVASSEHSCGSARPPATAAVPTVALTAAGPLALALTAGAGAGTAVGLGGSLPAVGPAAAAGAWDPPLPPLVLAPAVALALAPLLAPAQVRGAAAALPVACIDSDENHCNASACAANAADSSVAVVPEVAGADEPVLAPVAVPSWLPHYLFADAAPGVTLYAVDTGATDLAPALARGAGPLPAAETEGATGTPYMGANAATAAAVSATAGAAYAGAIAAADRALAANTTASGANATNADDAMKRAQTLLAAAGEHARSAKELTVLAATAVAACSANVATVAAVEASAGGADAPAVGSGGAGAGSGAGAGLSDRSAASAAAAGLVTVHAGPGGSGVPADLLVHARRLYAATAAAAVKTAPTAAAAGGSAAAAATARALTTETLSRALALGDPVALVVAAARGLGASGLRGAELRDRVRALLCAAPRLVRSHVLYQGAFADADAAALLNGTAGGAAGDASAQQAQAQALASVSKMSDGTARAQALTATVASMASQTPAQRQGGGGGGGADGGGSGGGGAAAGGAGVSTVRSIDLLVESAAMTPRVRVIARSDLPEHVPRALRLPAPLPEAAARLPRALAPLNTSTSCSFYRNTSAASQPPLNGLVAPSASVPVTVSATASAAASALDDGLLGGDDGAVALNTGAAVPAASRAPLVWEARRARGDPTDWLPRGALLTSFRDHGARITGLAVASDSTFVATGCMDGQVRVFATNEFRNAPLVGASGSFVHAHYAPPVTDTDPAAGATPVTSLAVGSRTPLLISGGADGSVAVAAVADGACRAVARLQTVYTADAGAAPVVAVEHMPSVSASLVLAASSTGIVHGWDLRSGTAAFTVGGDPSWGALSAMATGPGPHALITGSHTGHIGVFDLRFRVPVALWSLPQRNRVRCLYTENAVTLLPTQNGHALHSADSPLLAVGADGADELCLFDVLSGQLRTTFRSGAVAAGAAPVTSAVADAARWQWGAYTAALRPEHARLSRPLSLLTTASATAAVIAAALEAQVVEPSRPAFVSGFLYCPGSHVITAGSDRCVRLWNLAEPMASYRICSGTMPGRLAFSASVEHTETHSFAALQELAEESDNGAGGSGGVRHVTAHTNAISHLRAVEFPTKCLVTAANKHVKVWA